MLWCSFKKLFVKWCYWFVLNRKNSFLLKHLHEMIVPLCYLKVRFPKQKENFTFKTNSRQT